MKPSEALKSLQEFIEQNSGGYRDAEDWATVQGLLATIRQGVVRQYDKFDELSEWVDVYFSERKHRQYAGGLPQVRVWINTAIDTLKGCLVASDYAKAKRRYSDAVRGKLKPDVSIEEKPGGGS